VIDNNAWSSIFSVSTFLDISYEFVHLAATTYNNSLISIYRGSPLMGRQSIASKDSVSCMAVALLTCLSTVDVLFVEITESVSTYR
jgi:hypothetical protein